MSGSLRSERSKKGPYLRAHNKLSLGLDRLLPAIAAVEASTLELVRPPPNPRHVASFWPLPATDENALGSLD